MDNCEVDPNVKLILDVKTNKGVFPLTVDSAIIAHSPSGEIAYLDSVVDYLYQLAANKLKLYTELDGVHTKGKAYPATMGVQNTNSINALLNTINSYTSTLAALQRQLNSITSTDATVPYNNTATPVTTITVGSNGLVIKEGSIVAIDMPKGAAVNMKDCIVYKDVSETVTNKQYEVVNFGLSNITIGNTVVYPKDSIIVKAKPNVHIDFSDVTAINALDIHDITFAERENLANH